MVGARIELVPRQTAADGAALAQLLERSGATILQATPATWRMLLETGWSGGDGFRALCGGEALSRPLADSLLKCVGQLWNLYGPTETTVWSTVDRIESGTHAISIGRPIANTQVHILDPAGERVPVGVVGAICIGGDGLADGYHRRPALTAERFVPDCRAAAAGRRLYVTGDLGRWGADGKLYHVGRGDTQVKIRGFRIELAEIERVLEEQAEVRQAVVVVRDAQTGDPRLIAYATYRPGQDLTPGEVRERLRRRLPEFMVPSIVIPLLSMPVTPNGKADRAALPDPFRNSLQAVPSREPPATATEKIVADTWKSVLKVDNVGVGDNFFDLGGYSLLSLRVVKLIEERTGRQIDPRVLFFKDLRQVAALLETEPASRASSEA
jgi:acyl-CoA synthetase (AMP-forming)/AMP-acid ligase II